MRILGVDPGLSRTGWGLLEAGHAGIRLIDRGVISTTSKETFPRRLMKIYAGLQDIVSRLAPEVLAIEDVIFVENARIALKLGQARGVVLLLAAQNDLPVASYAPRTIKESLTGNGSASKLQMQRMVKSLLGLPEMPSPHDVADAIAVALCHFHRYRNKL
ncbi:MAG: crossover junction endodeoxyribonuclease RuvC [candidate division KSB1 bacterium]|nr:crossover junction endodeoxyribonuclease RuvC [candidate division KSB1 bacterium]MDQ7063808.1 crossover junction endodeoxyribonuclease RuvC [candidate division KSB1 bacterium]